MSPLSPRGGHKGHKGQGDNNSNYPYYLPQNPTENQDNNFPVVLVEPTTNNTNNTNNTILPVLPDYIKILKILKEVDSPLTISEIAKLSNLDDKIVRSIVARPDRENLLTKGYVKVSAIPPAGKPHSHRYYQKIPLVGLVISEYESCLRRGMARTTLG